MFGRVLIVAGRMGVSALVRGDDHSTVLRQSLNSFLHSAVVVGAAVVASADKFEMTKTCRKLDISCGMQPL